MAEIKTAAQLVAERLTMLPEGERPPVAICAVNALRAAGLLVSPPTGDEREALRQGFREYLGTEVYWCSRDHSAWGHGTMGLDDFSLAAEDDDIIDSLVEIADRARLVNANAEVDYYEGLEEGIKIGRGEVEAEREAVWALMQSRGFRLVNADTEQQDFRDGTIIVKLAEAEAERDAAVAAVEAARKLHHKITRWGNDMYSISAESYEDDPSSYEDLDPFDLCAECYEVEKLICEECGGDAPIGHRSSWPCPTVAALDGAPEPEDVEWTYRARLQSCGFVTEGYISAEYAMEGLRSELEEHPYLVMDDTAIVERTRVREWLPVEGESK